MDESIRDVIRSVLAEVLEKEQMLLDDDTDMYVEYGLDSIGMMGTLVRLENLLEVTVPDDELTSENLRYFGKLCRLMNGLVEKRKEL